MLRIPLGIGLRSAEILHSHNCLVEFPVSFSHLNSFKVPANASVFASQNAYQGPVPRLPRRVRQGKASDPVLFSHSTLFPPASRHLAVAMEGTTADTKQDLADSTCGNSHDPEILKSEEDKKRYRMVTLENGLVALLIHDPEISLMMSQKEEKAGDEASGGTNGSSGVKNAGVTAAAQTESGERPKADAMKDEGSESDDEWETDSGEDEDMGEGEEEEGEKGVDLKSGRQGEGEEAAARKVSGKSGRTKVGSGGVKVGGRRKRGKQPSGKKKGGVKGSGDEETEGAGEEEEEADGSDVEGYEEDEEIDEEDGEEEEEEDEEEDQDEDEEGGTKQHGAQQATKKAAAAMCVGVGSLLDPDDAPGLAHFLEHMLFMGSEKYPDENDYDAFLKHHGGGSNAFTDTQFTCYHFDVDPLHLRPALDRFAQFFIAPLAKAEAMDREVQAVDSEFSQVLQSDACRLQQLQCHTTVSPLHPFHKFTWGNRKSLVDDPKSAQVDVRQGLLDLYSQCYTAGAMRLAVLGGDSLDSLEAMARDLFSPARPGGCGLHPVPVPVPVPAPHPVPVSHPGSAPASLLPTTLPTPNGSTPTEAIPTANGSSSLIADSESWRDIWHGGMLYEVAAVKDKEEVSLTWTLPSLFARYRSKPQDYLSHLIGHEGAGSLLAHLKAQGWATDLSAGVGEGGYERTILAFVFAITITLTQAGRENFHSVLASVFHYINMLKQGEPQHWVFEELQAISAVDFRFAEEEAAEDCVVRLGANMFIYPKEHVIFGDYIHTLWDPSAISELLSLLTPQRARYDLLTHTFDSTREGVSHEPWFSTPFLSHPLSSSLLTQWSSPDWLDTTGALHLPPRNDFIPTDFSLRLKPHSHSHSHTDASSPPSPTLTRSDISGVAPVTSEALGGEKDADVAVAASQQQPHLIRDDARMRVWYKQDDVFFTPRVNALFAISSPVAMESAKAVALSELLVKLLADSLNETIYLASVAKLDAHLSVSGYKFEVKVTGFSHKLPVLAACVFQHIAAFEGKLKEERFNVLKEDLARSYRNANLKPLRHAAYLRLLLLRQPAWRTEERLEALLSSDVADMKDFIGRLLRETHIEALIHGNATADEALALAATAGAVLHDTQASSLASNGTQASSNGGISGGGGDKGGSKAAGGLSVVDLPEEKVVQLPGGERLLVEERVVNLSEENSAVELYFQLQPDLGLSSLRHRALVDLFEQMLSEPLYDDLRTKQQLGYRVDCGTRLTHRVLGFCIRVQSADYDPTYLQNCIDKFLLSFRVGMVSMTSDEFASHVSSLHMLKLRKDQSLGEETDKLWEQIWDKNYLFDTRQREAALLKSVLLDDVRVWMDKYVLNNGFKHAFIGSEKAEEAGLESTKCLMVHVWGTDHWSKRQSSVPVDQASRPEVRLVSDIEAFKQESAIVNIKATC